MRCATSATRSSGAPANPPATGNAGRSVPFMNASLSCLESHTTEIKYPPSVGPATCDLCPSGRPSGGCTGVNAERMDGLLARIKESGGPPEGIATTGLRVLHDAGQGTAVVEQYFATAEDMEAGGQAFSAMDVAETPGTRSSVDACEVK